MSYRRSLAGGIGGSLLVAVAIAVCVFRDSTSLTGTWTSESPIADVPAGAVRVEVNPDGTGLLLVDKDWIYRGFEYRLTSAHLIVRLGLPDEIQSKGEFRFQYGVHDGLLTLSAADAETRKVFPIPTHFRKVADPGTSQRLHTNSL